MSGYLFQCNSKGVNEDMFEKQKMYAEKYRQLRNDENAGISIAIGEVLGLVVLDVIALALVSIVASSATSAAGNLTDNPSAAGMVSIVVLFYIIVIIVANVAVVMLLIKH